MDRRWKNWIRRWFKRLSWEIMREEKVAKMLLFQSLDLMLVYTFLISTVFQCEYPCIFISLVRKEIIAEGRLLLKYLLISTLAVWLGLKKKLALKKWTQSGVSFARCDPVVPCLRLSWIWVLFFLLQKYLHWLCYRFAFSIELLQLCGIYLWNPLSF